MNSFLTLLEVRTGSPKTKKIYQGDPSTSSVTLS